MENTKILALIIILGVLVILFLITLFVINFLMSKRKLLEKENKLKDFENRAKIALIKSIVEAEEKNKTEIARNLHDQIIPVLTLKSLALKTNISDLENGHKNYSSLRQGVDEIASLADDIREIIHGIIPGMFTSFGLTKSIEKLILDLNGVNGSITKFIDNRRDQKDIILSEVQQLTLFRVCAEILNNLLKHAKMNYLEVTLEDSTSEITLTFAHDGSGITNSEINNLTITSSGIGLKSLQSRILALNGKIDYSVEEGVSFVKLQIPTLNDNKN